MMILKIAWLNIWRSKTRSLVVITAIIIGVWAVIFLSSFSVGMGQSYIDNAIQNEISHLQIHDEGFKDDQDVKYIIRNVSDVGNQINEVEGIKAMTFRTILSGMIASSRSTKGVEIRGVDPDSEHDVTNLKDKIVEGQYFNGSKRNTIIIGKKLAEKLKVNVRKKVTLRFQDAEHNLVDGAFRIIGIYETSNSANDEMIVFVRRDQINEILLEPDAAHEMAMLINDIEQIEPIQNELSQKAGGLLVENYGEIAPEIAMFNSQIGLTSIIFTVIVMIGLIFGIVNTMLMAVLERIKELGMLMSVGMNKIKIFLMVMFETLLLGIVGMPIGLLLGFLTVNWLSNRGINLSQWSDAMKEFGMSEIVYPQINSDMFIQLAFAVLLTSFLAAIYPAYKATSLNPVQAIRTL